MEWEVPLSCSLTLIHEDYISTWILHIWGIVTKYSGMPLGMCRDDSQHSHMLCLGQLFPLQIREKVLNSS